MSSSLGRASVYIVFEIAIGKKLMLSHGVLGAKLPCNLLCWQHALSEEVNLNRRMARICSRLSIVTGATNLTRGEELKLI